jgi:hypothetical protein
MSLNACDARRKWPVFAGFAGRWPVFAFAQFRPTLGFSMVSLRGSIRPPNVGNAIE